MTQEARQVGPHHQILERLDPGRERSRTQVARERVHPHVPTLPTVADQIEETFPVFVIPEYLPTTLTAVHRVVPQVGFDESKRSYHGRRLSQGNNMSSEDLTPFLVDLLPIDQETITAFLDAQRQHEAQLTQRGDLVRDLLHFSVMKQNGIETIISADADFDQFEGIHRLDPTAID